MAEDSPSQARGMMSTSPGGPCDLSCLLYLGLEVFSLEMCGSLVSAWGQAPWQKKGKVAGAEGEAAVGTEEVAEKGIEAALADVCPCQAMNPCS